MERKLWELLASRVKDAAFLRPGLAAPPEHPHFPTALPAGALLVAPPRPSRGPAPPPTSVVMSRLWQRPQLVFCSGGDGHSLGRWRGCSS